MKVTIEMNKLKAKSIAYQYIRPREEEKTKVKKSDKRDMF
jgi:hypothetical protein